MHTARSRFAKYSKAVHSASFHEYFEKCKGLLTACKKTTEMENLNKIITNLF